MGENNLIFKKEIDNKGKSNDSEDWETNAKTNPKFWSLEKINIK